MEPNRNILFKIRNLLKRAEANSGASLNEQLTCAEIAQRLMDTYRISYEVAMNESDDFRFAQEPVIDYIKEKREPFMSLRNPPAWIQGLCHVVALHNNCEVYVTTCVQQVEDGSHDKFSAFSIVGRMTDIMIVAELCWWLEGEIYRIGKRDGVGKDASWLNDFYMGAVRKIGEKFNHLKNEKKEIAGITEEQMKNALVRIDEKRKEVSNFFDKNGGSNRWKDAGKKKSQDLIAFSKGYSSASEIALSRPKVLDTKEMKNIKG